MLRRSHSPLFIAGVAAVLSANRLHFGRREPIMSERCQLSMHVPCSPSVLPLLTQYKKVLYIDNDVLINADLNDMFDAYDMEGGGHIYAAQEGEFWRMWKYVLPSMLLGRWCDFARHTMTFSEWFEWFALDIYISLGAAGQAEVTSPRREAVRSSAGADAIHPLYGGHLRSIP